jgi:hypothetical protein
MAFPPQEFYKIERPQLCEEGYLVLTLLSTEMHTDQGLRIWNAFTLHS